MRNMSFMLTTEQMYDRIKDVTRRVGWWFLKPGDVVMAVEKGMGLKKGDKIKRIYPIFIVSVLPEPLNRLITDLDYGWAEVKREGFQNLTPRQFVDMFCLSHKCKPDKVINRIEFSETKV